MVKFESGLNLKILYFFQVCLEILKFEQNLNFLREVLSVFKLEIF